MQEQLTREGLLLCLSSRQKYKGVTVYLSACLQGNSNVFKLINECLFQTLVETNVAAFSRLNALRLYRDIILSGNVSLINNLSSEIQGQILQAAQYNPTSAEMSKGSNYFKGASTEESIKISSSYVLMAMQIITFMGKVYGKDQKGEPTRFALYVEQSKHVVFPTAKQPHYFKKEDQEKFKTNYQRWNKKVAEGREEGGQEIKELKKIIIQLREEKQKIVGMLKSAEMHAAQCEKQLNYKQNSQNSADTNQIVRLQIQNSEKCVLLEEKQKIIEKKQEEIEQNQKQIKIMQKQIKKLREIIQKQINVVKQQVMPQKSMQAKTEDKKIKQLQIDVNNSYNVQLKNNVVERIKKNKIQNQRNNSILDDINVANVITMCEAKRHKPIPRIELSKQLKQTPSKLRGLPKNQHHRTAPQNHTAKWHNRDNFKDE